ncbi:MAG: hypothetical protein C4293_07910 [Nitrospiraceae bacterium]
MHFDPAIAAQQSFVRAQQAGELGDTLDAAVKAEEIFSASAGEEAKTAYELLQQIGEQQHHKARCFQEFLIYITWQQVTEETIPRHLRKGLEKGWNCAIGIFRSGETATRRRWNRFVQSVYRFVRA